MKYALLAALLWVVSTASADPAREDKLKEAWQSWYAQHRVGLTELAVVEDGALHLDLARAGTAGRVAPLASLSKAITASCVRALVEDGRLAFEDPVAAHLGAGWEGITIGALITHAGGLWPDSTQQRMWDWVNDPEDRHGDIAEAIDNRPRDAVGYRYNNENYAVLGTVIEAVTGEAYAPACKTRLGVPGAERSPRYGAFLPWGGWAMAAADYATFIETHYGAARDPAATPNAPVGGGARYGLGALYFEAEGLRITWHTGLLCFGSIDGAGAYFVQLSPGPTVAVTFEGCPGEEALADLDRALLAALLR